MTFRKGKSTVDDKRTLHTLVSKNAPRRLLIVSAASCLSSEENPVRINRLILTLERGKRGTLSYMVPSEH